MASVIGWPSSPAETPAWGTRSLGKLLQEGAKVAIIGRRPTTISDAATRLADLGPVAAFPADAGEPHTLSQVIAAIEDHLGPPLILVNNAGTSVPTTFDELDEESWRTVWGTKLYLHLWCIRACLPTMRSAGWGRIINIAGLYGHEPTGTKIAQGVNLAALINLTKGLARSLGPEGITVNAVSPGPFDTDRQRRTSARQAELRGADVRTLRQSARRAGRPLGKARGIGGRRGVPRLRASFVRDGQHDLGRWR